MEQKGKDQMILEGQIGEVIAFRELMILQFADLHEEMSLEKGHSLMAQL